ncbi:hypothetical protein [Sorangium cellulosum]|uniref:PGRS family protein n=2 Tax=Sorangium cellulosum TaxID=56 RepID=S4YAL1_SORCE|nr:hypothetical protein [Sorangium cellulosum]AGP41919.1 hypothetical protein SCE1572_49955 [Sorangium cellulosum So0157-2]
MPRSIQRARSWRSAFTEALVLMLASCAFGTGCAEVPCGPRLRCEPPAEEELPDKEPPCPDEPQGGLVATDECGVFVSSSLGHDRNPGTSKAPVKTIGRAIELLAQEPQRPPRVHACSENFPEAVRVRGTLEIWGGFDCHLEWIHDGGGRNTVIEPEPDETPLTFEADATATVFDLEARAASATAPGGSSIAAIMLEGARVTLHRGALVAGDGARGRDGAPGDPKNAPGRAGRHGRFGEDACTGDFVLGGDQAHTACEQADSIGGRGGDGTVDHGAPGGDGELMPIPNLTGFGLGGRGATSTDDCLAGQTGANGPDGAHGLGARGLGAFSSRGHYLGVNGGDGGDGGPGQGGGGGGGTRAGAMFCGTARNAGGAGGGSGGSGGCGGRGGHGGGHGGASVGLVILNARVELHGTGVTAARGGDGGHGGVFQIGGAPGLGAPGGQGFGGSPFGCSGGDGGKGGNGGHGGGGQGGPSIAVAVVGPSLPVVMEAELTAGTGGKGGLGANPSVAGSAGDDGLAIAVAGFPQ